MNDEFLKRIQVGTRLAQEAGEILRGFYGRLDGYEKKGPIDLVTRADTASEEHLKTEFGRAFPEDGFLAEEGGKASHGSSGYKWVVDPLDGTTNFVHCYPQFAVSIGLLFENKEVFGVVFAPICEELYTGIKGGGAFLNGRSISVSKTSCLDASLIASGFPYDRRERIEELLGRVERVVAVAQGFRRMGAAALDLCAVAAGRADGFWEDSLNAWDLAAGVAIIEAAGGKVTGFDGGEHDLYGANTVASNGLIHEDLIKTLFPTGIGSGK
jgi:myo-inositol-1(or 4)-monophosphatase